MKYVECEVVEKTAYIIPIGDVHWGDKSFHKEGKAKLLGYLEWVKARPNARIFLNGDIFNVASRVSKTDPFSTDTNEYLEVIEFFRPYASQIIGAVDGNHECFDEQTEILSKRGWLKYNEIRDDEVVLTFNNGTAEWQKILARHVYPFTGTLNRIKTKLTDLLVTDNHRFIYQNYWDRKSYKINTLSELSQSPSRRFLPASGVSNKSDYALSDDEIAISAWFLAEGWYHSSYRFIRFAQRKGKVKLITDILDRLNINYSLIERDRKTEYICGKQVKKQDIQCEVHVLKPHHDTIRKLVPTKAQLPIWVSELSERQFDIFLKNYILADGSIHKSSPKSLMIYGSDKRLINDFHAMLPLNGYRSSVSEYAKGCFRINITKNKSLSLDGGFKNNIKEELYSGNVWCVTTPNDTVFVRRNGKSVFTGNSRMMDMFGVSPTQYFCLALNIPYCKWSAVVRLKVGKRNNGYWKQNYFLYFHHTTGGGGSIGSKLNRVAKLRDIVEGIDVYFGSHNHQLAVAPQDVLLPSIQKHDVIKRRIWYVDCGSYLEWEDSYAEKGMLAPTKLGSPRVRFSGTNDHDIHISL